MGGLAANCNLLLEAVAKGRIRPFQYFYSGRNFSVHHSQSFVISFSCNQKLLQKINIHEYKDFEIAI